MEKEAAEACSLIKDPKDSFRQCGKIINSTKFFDICKRDYCAAANSKTNPEKAKADSLCRSFEMMAYQCSENFMNLEWRRADRCRKYIFIKNKTF